MKPKPHTIFLLIALLAIFASGYAAGVNRFGMPKTILHVVVIQWKPTTTPAQKRAVIDGVRQMAARIPGIRNVWLKPVRIASMKWDTAFAIEFSSHAAADRYASDPTHAAWAKLEQTARLDSLNVQIGN